MPEKWRKCIRCVCDGTNECDVAQEKATNAETCKGPYRSFKEKRRKELRHSKNR